MNMLKNFFNFKKTIIATLILSVFSSISAYAYDAGAARTYARYWGQKGMYNLNEYYQASLDCTNFVSQCLEKGGYTRSSSLPTYEDTRYWRPRSGTWENASYFNTYWRNKGNFLDYWYLNSNNKVLIADYAYIDLYVGDVIQLGYSSSDIRHSQFVHDYGYNYSLGKSTLLIAQHSSNDINIDYHDYLRFTGYTYICYFDM